MYLYHRRAVLEGYVYVISPEALVLGNWGINLVWRWYPEQYKKLSLLCRLISGEEPLNFEQALCCAYRVLVCDYCLDIIQLV